MRRNNRSEERAEALSITEKEVIACFKSEE
nr:MAG TPA: hypothetical protein [Caudoviricetes sp.]